MSQTWLEYLSILCMQTANHHSVKSLSKSGDLLILLCKKCCDLAQWTFQIWAGLTVINPVPTPSPSAGSKCHDHNLGATLEVGCDQQECIYPTFCGKSRHKWVKGGPSRQTSSYFVFVTDGVWMQSSWPFGPHNIKSPHRFHKKRIGG